ncbi:MAG: hypothetical protein AB7S77_19260 [Desulfatirhabdiaceae bacterium]
MNFILRGTIGDVTVHDSSSDDGVYGKIRTDQVDLDVCRKVAVAMGYFNSVEIGKRILKDYLAWIDEQ